MKTFTNILFMLVLLLQNPVIKASWPAIYPDNPSGLYYGHVITADNSGNCYVSGLNNVGNYNGWMQYNVTTLKYNSEGTLVWMREHDMHRAFSYTSKMIYYHGPENDFIFITGYLFPVNGGPDDFDYRIFTLAYKINGDEAWYQEYNVIGKSDVGNSIACDAFGNVYVAGFTNNNPAWTMDGSKFAVIKYDLEGHQVWVREIFHNYYDIAYSVKVFGSFVCAGGLTNNGSNNDFMTVLWDNNGTEQWRTTYDNNNGNDTVKDLTINYSGVYVTGCSESSGPKATTIKYNFSGGQDWVNNEFAGCNNSIQIFERQIGYGVKGPTTRLTDVFTTGYSGLYPSNCSGQTIRYTISGGVDWRKTYSTNRQLDLLSLKLDNAENVIVTGFDFSGNIFGNPVGYTIKYNNAGVLQWVNTLSSHSFLWLFDLALDPSGNAFVAGTASNDYIGNSIPVFENELNMSAYYITTKYETDNGGDNQDNFNSFTANKYNLSQNHPNPFNPSTTIKYSIPYSGFVSIKVYDMLGREIVQLVNEFKESGNYDVIFDGSNLSSGVYIYRLQAGLFSDMKKMILIR